MALLSRQLIESHVGPEWTDLLMPFMASEAMDEILLKLREERGAGKSIIPETEIVFRAFRETPLSEVRVCVLGADPYPRKDHAMGIAFGCPQDQPEPASLTQIFYAVEKDTYAGLDLNNGGLENRDKTLLKWCKQGVLMLNCALTVIENDPGSHADLWYPFTQYVVDALQDVKRGLIFLAWGGKAIEITKNINLYLGDHHLLTAEHPVNAAREQRWWKVDHFTRANAIIVANRRGAPIQWL